MDRLYLHRELCKKKKRASGTVGEIEDGSKETFLSAQGDIAGLGISSTQLVEEGKVSFLFQFSPSKFLVRNCAGNVFSFFPRSLGRIMKCLRFCSP